MCRAWLFILALFIAAPADAGIFKDGFEKRMAESDWVQLIGPNDGTFTEYSIPALPVAPDVAGSIPVTIFDAPVVDISDFPETPTVITGVEFRMRVYASHPGVSVKEFNHLSEWLKLSGAGEMFISGGGVSPSPEITTDPAGEWLAFGGYGSGVNSAGGAFGGTPPVALPIATEPDFWLDYLTVTCSPGPDYDERTTTINIQVQNAGGYNATLYVDVLEIRLHYTTGSYAALSGGGTMSVVLEKQKPISTGLSGSGTVAATMNGQRVLSAAMRGTGRISPALTKNSGGVISTYLMPELSGSGTMTVAPLVRYAPVRSSMTGRGTMTVTLQHGKAITAPSRNGNLTLPGTGIMGARVSSKKPLSRALTGSGMLSATVLAYRPIPAALAGSGTMAVSAIAQRPVSEDFSGSGTLSVALQAGRVMSTQNLSGGGTMAVTLLAHRPVSAALVGTGVIDIDESAITANTRLAAGEHCTFIVPVRNREFVVPSRDNTFEVTEC